MAPVPLFSLDDFESYDGDIDADSSHSNTTTSATPPFVSSRAVPARYHVHIQQGLSNLQICDELIAWQPSNRSTSARNFSPGPHRRSHPNLQHLSLAPLTPRYPITPSDYTAYVDPDTSQLHTSSSLSHIANTPSPSGILSPAHGRANSRTRNTNSHSSLSIQGAFGTASGAVTSEGLGGMMMNSADLRDRQRAPAFHNNPKKTDSGWLLQTGITLTEGSRESKGQSWLFKRASSTSLHSPTTEDYAYFEYPQHRSGRGTPNRGRRGRSSERRKSRRELAMTPAAIGAVTDDARTSQGFRTSAPTHDCAAMVPDWADSQTQAEIAADLEMELAAELDDGELYSDDGDGYDVLDSQRQGIEDEKEIQEAVNTRGFMLGKWVDGVIDVLLKMDDADEEESDANHNRPDHEAAANREDEKKDSNLSGQPNEEELGEHVSDDDDTEPPPQNPKTVWEDLAWFTRLVLRTAKS